MSDKIPTPLVDAMCQDDFLANYYSDPTEFYVPAEFARGLERELASCRQSQEMQSQKFNELEAELAKFKSRSGSTTCNKCGLFVPGHATGWGDMCCCEIT